MIVSRRAKGKHFFFEKKNQKTFLMLSRVLCEVHSRKQKFFGSFFQKRTFFLRFPVLLPLPRHHPVAAPTLVTTKSRNARTLAGGKCREG